MDYVHKKQQFSFLEGKVLVLMFNDSSRCGSVVLTRSPTLCPIFYNNIINTEDYLKMIKIGHLRERE